MIGTSCESNTLETWPLGEDYPVSREVFSLCNSMHALGVGKGSGSVSDCSQGRFFLSLKHGTLYLHVTGNGDNSKGPVCVG